MRDTAGIFKNTAILYVRMAVLLVISLYTTRVVLDALGVVDFGLYNVVGGVVVAIGFLTGTLNTASSRFITVALGRGRAHEQVATFSNILFVNLSLAVAVAVVCETIGLWFLHNKMVIPAERMQAAAVVYQLSVATVVMNFLSIPYNACIIAHERMKAFAYITLVDAFGKFVIAYSLLHVGGSDKLVLYASLLFLVHVFDQVVYVTYCRRNFAETVIEWRVDKHIVKKAGGFILWASYGSLVSVGYTQGLNILLNMFCGPALNAARALSVQIQNVIVMFTNNFQTAVNPRIIKSMATGEHVTVKQLLNFSSKISFFLLCIIGVPLFFIVPEVLSLWLHEVPEHTVAFVRWMIVISIFSSVANPLRVINQAEGHIRKFQLCECSILLTIVPLSYVALRQGYAPESVFFIHFLIEVIAHAIRAKIVLPKIDVSALSYFRSVYLPPVVVFALSMGAGALLSKALPTDLLGRGLLLLSVEAILLCCMYGIGLGRSERRGIKAMLSQKHIRL